MRSRLSTLIVSLMALAAIQVAGQQQSGIFVILDPAPSQQSSVLRAHATRTQTELRSWLIREGVEHRAFWISNRVYLPAPTPVLVKRLQAAGYKVEPSRVYRIPPPISPLAAPAPRGVEWHITTVRADQVWSQTKGAGIVVANIDTGVDVTHQVFTGAFTGLWKDPTGVCPKDVACDNDGHGTGTMSLMVARPDGQNIVGIAPAAKFMACKGCATGMCFDFHLLECAQFILDPHGDGSGRDKPHLVNNSWGGSPGDDWYRDAVQAWERAGIMVFFAAGNSGPSCRTANSPGDYPEGIAAGATDSADNIVAFSSRGPSVLDGGIKPDVVAPGDRVRYAKPGGVYGIASGTSFASPITAAVVALLRTKTPDLAVIRKALTSTARSRASTDCGAAGPPNNVYGWGLIDSKAAYDSIGATPPLPNQPPTLEILAPVDGAQYKCGVVLTFEGRAIDPEDGILESIVWWNLYPFWRGTGPRPEGFTGVSCDVGLHRVIAEVTDSGGLRVERQVTIEIVR